MGGEVDDESRVVREDGGRSAARENDGVVDCVSEADGGGMSDESGHRRDNEKELRLRACPGCEYSFEMLPEVGVCPECGRGYDQGYLVYGGRGRGVYDRGGQGTWRGVVWQGVAIVFLMWMWRMRRWGGVDPVLIVVGAVVVAGMLGQVYAALFSSRRGRRMQLWVCEAGVAQVVASPEARRVAWVVEGMSILVAPAFFVAIMAQAGPGWGWAWGGGAVVVLTWLVSRWWRGREAWLGYGDGREYVPGVWPWGGFEVVEVGHWRDGWVRVRCQVARRWARVVVQYDWVADIEVECSAEEAGGLRKVMFRWWEEAAVLAAGKARVEES